MSMPEIPANLQSALEACRACARTSPTGEISFRAIPQEYKDKGVVHHDLAKLEKLGYLTRIDQGLYVLGIHFPEAFDWWRRRYKWHRFPFECACKVEFPIRHRVTQKTRKCPNCGTPITIQAIDDQLRSWEPERQRIMEAESGCGSTLVMLFVAIFMFGLSLLYKES